MVQFFSQHEYEDLQADENSVHPILQVDAIRFLYSFRNQVRVPDIHSCRIMLLINFAAHKRTTPLCPSSTRLTSALAELRMLYVCSDNHRADIVHQARVILTVRNAVV